MVRDFLRSQGEREVFLEPEIKEFLRGFGFSTPRGIFIPAGGDLPSTIPLSYPLVAKVVSTGIGSKSEVGGVRLAIEDMDELQKAVKEILRLESAEGVLVEEMAGPGFEVIVGGTTDITFGPVVMFGMGGFFVELFRDVAFVLAPASRDQALWLVGETKGERVLKGFRGNPPLDMDAVTDLIVTVSELMATGLIMSMELNPVVVYPSGALVLDAKMRRLQPVPSDRCFDPQR